MGGLKDKMRMKTFGRCVNTLELRTSGSKMRTLVFSVIESGILTFTHLGSEAVSYKQIHKCFKDCTWKMVRQEEKSKNYMTEAWQIVRRFKE